MRRSLIVGPVLAVVALVLPSPFCHTDPDAKAVHASLGTSRHPANGQGIPGVEPAGAGIVDGPATGQPWSSQKGIRHVSYPSVVGSPADRQHAGRL